ncbi:outer membrane receptor protein involved in Fe transport [Novosphingobium sp. SG751A]|uniref:TonB-dependent receptor domain-containing protein n=1 Tax=Novosphingobium sp. SG751A TaxID=2587000 RepID=UPI00155779CB|nr:TonB-dependent receptor [Novosphingobium sp. SG751A]NOW47473.1 outer membrane receptor protein involved in Fe transport [Novosphingobium sp. SG751A]
MSYAKQSLIVSASLIGLSAAFSAPAMAADDAAKAQEIVVTGSLIKRPNNTAVSPIVSVGEATIKESGAATLQDALNQVPSFTVGGNAATGGQGGGGRASINLHGLGTNRNLVLLDGHRLPVSDINGNVDVNILPDAIISSVDAITGGASAVYGSDAMSGVVNFKTIRNFEGIKADIMNSISQQGDAFKFNASLALGTKFADDRGHLIAAFSYAKQDPVLSNTRSFFLDKVPSSYIGTGTFVPSAGNAPNAAVVQGIFAGYGVTSLPANYQLANLGFNNDGTLFIQNGAQNYKGANGTNGYALVGNNVRMPVGQQGNLLNALDRKTAFIKGDFEITPSLTAYGQFMFVDLSVNTNSGGSLTQFPTLTTIPVSNPFIPNDLRTILASRANPTANFSWNARYVGVPWKNWDENYQVQQYLAGLKGQIGGGWSFDVYASYDQSVHNQIMHNAVLKSRVQTLLNAADGGNSICAGGFNPFGDANARSLSDACRAYITKDTFSQERLSQTQIQGQVNGSLFDLGAGPAQIALVADYRKNTYSFTPDTDMTALSGWAPGANVEGFTATIGVPKRAISVKEFAAQIDVPLLADKAWAQELAVGAAGRISDYSVTGSVKSYEFDARWRPTRNLLVRGSYQRAVRAPNIGELFSPPSGSQLVIGTPPSSIGDPCDVRSSARTGANGAQVATLCAAQGVPSALISSYQFPTTATGQTVAGNSGVTPETADTFNIGIVLNSPFQSGPLSELSLSVDYYNINIKNVISSVPGLTVLSKCYNLDGSNPGYSTGNPYCQLISRDSSTGQLLTVSTPYLNLGAVKTDGVEAQIHWGTRAPVLGSGGKVYIDTAIGWLHAYKVQLLPGAAFLDYTGVSVGGSNPGSVPPRATPQWRALTTFGIKNDVFGAGLRWRYQSGMKDASAVLTPTNTQVGVGVYELWDLFGSVKVNKNFELRAGVNNMFNKSLPFVASSQNGTDTAMYDAIGRSFYVGLKLAM